LGRNLLATGIRLTAFIGRRDFITLLGAGGVDFVGAQNV
jgi:hypothetical protein